MGSQREGCDLRALGTFEGFPTDLAEVGPAFLVPAGYMSQQRPFLREALLTELTAEGPLTSVRSVVLVQAGYNGRGGCIWLSPSLPLRSV